ncbi:MAG: conjugal transfer protein TraL [Neisseria sp.]|nr:conjugal transfer protein TraL [Neisseria sp.]
MKEVHFIAQGKGGVGKSTIAAFLADYLQNKSNLPLTCFDTDPVNPTFSRYKAFKVEVIKILTDSNDIDTRFFDGLIEQLVEKDGIAVVDNGAATFVPLMSYLAENEVATLLAENGVRLLIHVPLQGGQALKDCMTGLTQILNSIQAEVVVWLNEFQGAIEVDGKQFTEFNAYQQNKERIVGIVSIPSRNPDTYGKDIHEMSNLNLSLTEVVNSNHFGMMPRQRMKTVQKGLYEQLDQVSFTATEHLAKEG